VTAWHKATYPLAVQAPAIFFWGQGRLLSRQDERPSIQALLRPEAQRRRRARSGAL